MCGVAEFPNLPSLGNMLIFLILDALLTNITPGIYNQQNFKAMDNFIGDLHKLDPN